MIFGVLSRFGRVRVTMGYLAALSSVSAVFLLFGPQVHQHLSRDTSTHLYSLAGGYLGTLWRGAFLIGDGPPYFWLPCLACLLALAELHFRSLRLTVVFAVGHVGSTLLVAAGLAAAVGRDWSPMFVTHASDVGMSYGALAVLGALTGAISRRWRPAWAGWWVSAGLGTAVTGGDISAAGYVISLLLGMLATMRFSSSVRWNPIRYMLLVVSSGFGFTVLAPSTWTSASGIVLGMLGALMVHRLARRNPLQGAPALTAAWSVLRV